MKAKFRLIFIYIFMITLAGRAFSQAEFLDTLNTATGQYTQIGHLTDVNFINICPEYTTFDKTHHRFIFKGKDVYGLDRLYTVDAVTGTILYSPLFYTFADPVDNIVELQYDNVSNQLYGLHWDNHDSTEYLVTVNPVSGTFSIIDSLPDVYMIMTNPHFIALDEIHRFYIFVGYDFSYNQSIYFVDLNTGYIDHTIPFVVTANGNPYFEMQYDNVTQTMFALHQDATLNQYFLVTVNTNSGAMTIIDSIPGVQGVYTMPSYTAFDEMRHRYLFVAVNNTNYSHLYSIDATTGSIIYSPQFPPANISPGDNLVELEFDNTTGILYCLNWDTKYLTTSDGHSDIAKEANMSAYPNPFSEELHIAFKREYNNIVLLMYDINGKIVRQQGFEKANEITISRDDLPAGSYMVSVFSNQKSLGMKQVIIR